MKQALFFVSCLVAAMVPLLSTGRTGPRPDSRFPGWLSHWDGAPLRRVEASERERQFAAGFPGHVAQFTDGRRVLLFRFTEEPTRKLHPAAHCFRGAGYKLKPLAQRTDLQGNRWGCTLGERDEEKLRICERIFDNGGGSWSDVSSWYWSAAFGATRGPWWAVTTVESATHDIL